MTPKMIEPSARGVHYTGNKSEVIRLLKTNTHGKYLSILTFPGMLLLARCERTSSQATSAPCGGDGKVAG